MGKISDLLVQVLIAFAVIAVALWLGAKFFGSSNSAISGLWDEVKGLFGSDDGDGGSSTTWLAPEGSGIPSQPIQPATPQQIANVQNGLSGYEQFANSSQPWQEQGFDWFMQQFSGDGSAIPAYLQPW